MVQRVYDPICQENAHPTLPIFLLPYTPPVLCAEPPPISPPSPCLHYEHCIVPEMRGPPFALGEASHVSHLATPSKACQSQNSFNADTMELAQTNQTKPPKPPLPVDIRQWLPARAVGSPKVLYKSFCGRSFAFLPPPLSDETRLPALHLHDGSSGCLPRPY
eukprot:EG_transcript_16218